MKKFLVILICFISIFSISGCKKKDNLNEIGENLTLYEIKLEVDTEAKKVNAYQEVYYINNTQSILKNIKFHLYPQFFEQGATEKIISSTKMNNAYPNGMSYADFNIDRVQVDDVEKSILYECEFDSILNVELNSSLLPKESTIITINFSFSLPNCCHRFGFGENTINLGNFYPIICVFENGKFNTSGYNANGDPFYSEMANYCVDITADRQYIVAGSGEKFDEKIENGNKITSFKANVIRDFAIVMSKDFKVVSHNIDNINIEYYYFNDTHAEQSLKAGADAIKTFSNLFGQYPYKTFSIVETNFIYGGMEYPNLVMISTDIDNHDDYLNVIIHETAHQWWYGIVGNDEFNFPWLDEALTEFSTILFYDHNEGYNLNHKQMINTSKENYTLFISVYEDVLGLIDTSLRAIDKYATEPEYTYCIYVKGVLMYESLYQLIGEKDFYKSLQTYFEENKYKNANPNDLILAFEKTTEQNLSNFFDSWISGKVIIR
ncbi:MAG: M1 family metallopeptidase [Clostridia bacterium]|nr:M1 family metallopeptidase [Clostridia bacterium]